MGMSTAERVAREMYEAPDNTMSPSRFASLPSTSAAEDRPSHVAPRAEVAASSPPGAEGGHWWFAFDRWLAVPADPIEDDFVLA